MAVSEFALGVIEAMLGEAGSHADRMSAADEVAVIALAMRFESEAGKLLEKTGMSRRSAGRLAWLDAAGHGVGFWVEDYAHLASRSAAARLGAKLSALADKHFSGLTPYIGDDGVLYVSGLPAPLAVYGRASRKRPEQT